MKGDDTLNGWRWNSATLVLIEREPIPAHLPGKGLDETFQLAALHFIVSKCFAFGDFSCFLHENGQRKWLREGNGKGNGEMTSGKDKLHIYSNHNVLAGTLFQYSTSFSDIKIGPQPESASLKALNQVSQPNMQIKILKSLHVTAVITPSLLFIYLFIFKSIYIYIYNI